MFLRGSQRPDDPGMCASDTIYPGWYATTNATDSIFLDGGEPTVLHLVGDVADGPDRLTGVLCLAVQARPAQRLQGVIESHVAAVAAADAARLGPLEVQIVNDRDHRVRRRRPLDHGPAGPGGL